MCEVVGAVAKRKVKAYIRMPWRKERRSVRQVGVLEVRLISLLRPRGMGYVSRLLDVLLVFKYRCFH